MTTEVQEENANPYNMNKSWHTEDEIGFQDANGVFFEKTKAKKEADIEEPVEQVAQEETPKDEPYKRPDYKKRYDDLKIQLIQGTQDEVLAAENEASKFSANEAAATWERRFLELQCKYDQLQLKITGRDHDGVNKEDEQIGTEISPSHLDVNPPVQVPKRRPRRASAPPGTPLCCDT